MLPLFIYILKAFLVSGILLGYYWIGLRNTRFHYYNRFYLVGTVLLSLALPLLDLQWFSISTPDSAPVQQVVRYIYQSEGVIQDKQGLTWDQVLVFSLSLVSAGLVVLFGVGVIKVYLLKSKGKVTVMERFNFIETTLDEAPFSFFRNLFWRKDLPVHDETGQRMLKHELTHIEQYHTYDKVFVTLMTNLFWMNPFNWIIRKELEVVHEFIADEEAVAGEDAAVLAEMLLKAHYHSNSLSIGQSFFYSSIKRRIIMLTSSKKVSYSYARRLLILPVAIGVLVLLSFTIKDSLSDVQNKQMDQSVISASKLDTVPAKYLDPKTGQIKGSFQIDIDGDMASFKDIKSKKELFKVPLTELAGLSNKKVSAEGSPLYTEKKIMFISADSMSAGTTYITTPDAIRLRGGTDGSKISRIIINGKEISPADLDKIDPVNIKTIDIRGSEKGVSITGKDLNGMTWSEATTADGKKIVTIKVDSVMFDGKAKVAVPLQGNVSNIHISVDTSEVVTVTGYKKNSNVSATIVRASDDKVVEKAKTDPNEPITVTGYKKNSNVSAITFRTTDDKVVEEAKKDPKTLTVTTTDKDGKKTITYVQKSTEKTELPKDVLYIIDGKEMESGSMKDIDPSIIKSINVLKGETAVKLYGEKGKNGVIEITTKKN
jgi:TonB-dependent SusC/RagA subfamily outer membrane receptor